jgi:hypothetical protein
VGWRTRMAEEQEKLESRIKGDITIGEAAAAAN